MKKYEFIEHTADVAVRIYGETLNDLFTNSACALIDLLIPRIPQGNKDKQVSLEAETLEDLLISWLNELISLLFADCFLATSFTLHITEENNLKKLQADLQGVDFDPYANTIKVEIKAATYHNLEIQHTREGCRVDVIFDV